MKVASALEGLTYCYAIVAAAYMYIAPQKGENIRENRPSQAF